MDGEIQTVFATGQLSTISKRTNYIIYIWNYCEIVIWMNVAALPN